MHVWASRMIAWTSGLPAPTICCVILAGCAMPDVDGSAVLDESAVPAADRAAGRPRTYAFGRKPDFIQDMANEMDACCLDADHLFPKVQDASDQVRAWSIPRIDRMRGLSADLYRQLASAASTAEPAWPGMTEGLARDLGRLKHGLADIRTRLDERSTNPRTTAPPTQGKP